MSERRMFSKKRTLQQLLSLVMACLLLVVAVGGRSFSENKQGRNDESVAKELSSPSSKGQDTSDQAKVSTLDLKAVVTPVISFNFLSHFHFVLPAVYRFVEVDSVFFPAYQVESHYFFAYLKKVFSHHIAINAP